MFTLLVVVAVSLSAAPASAQEADPETISVCDALLDPLKYHGRMVAVRGRLDYGGGEGTWLEDDCIQKLKTESELEWHDLIWTSARPSEAAQPLTFVPIAGEHAVNSVEMVVWQQIEEFKCCFRLWATYVGLFEAKNPKTAVYVNSRGVTSLSGFGHRGMAPAQLFIKSVKDPFIEPRRSPPR